MLRDQQQVTALNRKLIEQQQMAAPKALHLEALIPGQERIGLWPFAPQMLGGGGDQPTQNEGRAALDRLQCRLQGDQGAIGLGDGAALQRCRAVAP